MRIGKFNRRVRIERRMGQRDPSNGEELDVWVEVDTVWANVLMLTGKEVMVSDADVAEATASIRIRYRTDIDNGMRAVLLKYVDGQPVDDAIFNIGKPLPDFAGRQYTDLPCTTGSNDG
ncbi:phage head closure protein [Burkholderia anthina]|uniref:phage head closure protein n=1 Tax=Burkholderia anthina TaxID=179879 RepID=UPI001AA0A04D|nr:phage head closure protein [Burkholderia anthina]QTD91763.1 phage head closure protein [Burkholderia anthina]